MLQGKTKAYHEMHSSVRLRNEVFAEVRHFKTDVQVKHAAVT